MQLKRNGKTGLGLEIPTPDLMAIDILEGKSPEGVFEYLILQNNSFVGGSGFLLSNHVADYLKMKLSDWIKNGTIEYQYINDLTEAMSAGDSYGNWFDIEDFTKLLIILNQKLEIISNISDPLVMKMYEDTVDSVPTF